jgi:hypothetical protein
MVVRRVTGMESRRGDAGSGNGALFPGSGGALLLPGRRDREREEIAAMDCSAQNVERRALPTACGGEATPASNSPRRKASAPHQRRPTKLHDLNTRDAVFLSVY